MAQCITHEDSDELKLKTRVMCVCYFTVDRDKIFIKKSLKTSRFPCQSECVYNSVSSFVMACLKLIYVHISVFFPYSRNH